MKIEDIKGYIKSKADNINISPEAILCAALKTPGVKINRSKFLRKELLIHFSEDVVGKAIDKNPAYAGIGKDNIERIAKRVILYETNKVSAISFAAGLPGGYAMIATVPADLTQYFAFILRVMQKLAYLYGFGEFELREDSINDNTMNELLIFVGVMFGVQEAQKGIKVIASYAAARVVKTLSRKALTKGAVYPIVKKAAQQVGIRMTRQVFAKGVSKVVPVVGGVLCGGLTYATFMPCAYKLKKSLSRLRLCDPATYLSLNEFINTDVITSDT